jgi:serine phosphatase RsbU (regulator of sigma subunit)
MPKSEINLLNELDNVSKIHPLEREDIDKIMLDMAKKIVLALKIERINVWLFNPEKSAMISIAEYDKRTKKYVKDSVLHRKDFPNYFKAISENKIIVVEDIYTNKFTNELNEAYSKPNNICSLLDIPLRIGGELMGVMCYEKTEVHKKFTQEEIGFCLSVSFVLASNLESRYRRAAQTKLEEVLSEKDALISQINKQNVKITKQKNIVDAKNKELKDSMYYAEKIQSTLLSNHEIINKYTPDHFLFFKPKDIISGDFCFSIDNNNNLILAICDSTGHGVPGAFISILNTTFLFQAINEEKISQPNLIFDFVKSKLQNTLSKDFSNHGMDGFIMNYDVANLQLQYASANINALLISNNEAKLLSKDSMHVGLGEGDENFSLHHLKVNKNDILYIYTDGYADQFGGKDKDKRKGGGKKFKRKNLNELLLKIHQLSMQQQYEALETTLIEWKGKLEQTDDITIFGIRF